MEIMKMVLRGSLIFVIFSIAQCGEVFFNRTMRRSPVSRAKRDSRDIELRSSLRRLFKISSGLSRQLLFIVAGTRHRTKKSRYFGHRDGHRSAGSAIR